VSELGGPRWENATMIRHRNDAAVSTRERLKMLGTREWALLLGRLALLALGIYIAISGALGFWTSAHRDRLLGLVNI
jgi:hypothetical protein